MINKKGCGRKLAWSNLRYYSDVSMGVLKKNTKTSVRIANIRIEKCTRKITNAKQDRSTFESDLFH